VSNPEPGTVLDHTVTRRYLFDFFLVSQLIREVRLILLSPRLVLSSGQIYINVPFLKYIGYC
jgi:hypothetical protein